MNKQIIISVILAVAISSLMMLVFWPPTNSDTKHISAFERVQHTRTLRCSYAPLSPFLVIDPNTKEISGLFYDLLNEIGRRLNLKIDWVEEVGYGQIASGFTTGRYDAFCGVLWMTPARAAAMSFTTPLYLQNVSPCVSGKSTQYDQSVAGLNNPSKTLLGYDGDVSSQVARIVFPKAHIMTLPETMSFGEALQYVSSGKADGVATCDRIIVDDFNKSNPGGLKVAAPQSPITKIKVAIPLPIEDQSLKNMLDVTIFDMIADGTAEKSFTKYLGAERLKDTIVIPNN